MSKYRTVKRYIDGSYFTYSHGDFDDYHLMYHDRTGKIFGLLDKDYLQRLKATADFYGIDRVYGDFLTLVDQIVLQSKDNYENIQPTTKGFQMIAQLAIKYDNNSFMINKLYDCFYLTMISEWHRKGSVLHHRIKHLAVYQVLKLGMSPEVAARWSDHKPAAMLNAEMNKYGI